MRKHIFVDGKRVILDNQIDEIIFDAPCNPPNTGTRYTEGTDLYLHKDKHGNEHFYLYHWSMWQGVEARIESIPKEQAISFLSAKVDSYNGVSEDTLKRFGINEEE